VFAEFAYRERVDRWAPFGWTYIASGVAGRGWACGTRRHRAEVGATLQASDLGLSELQSTACQP